VATIDATRDPAANVAAPHSSDTATRTGSAGTPGTRGLSYIPGLDGIRAIAVLAVLLYHADVSWMPGGFLGVDMFFVLSGFLITSIVLTELERNGRLNFKQFYLRRARRLLPALFLVLALAAVLAACPGCIPGNGRRRQCAPRYFGCADLHHQLGLHLH